MIRSRFLAVGAACLAAMLSGCSGIGSSNQVIVHLEGGAGDLAEATRVAEDTCRSRGGRARFVLIIQNHVGSRDSYLPRPPDAVFACDPAT